LLPLAPRFEADQHQRYADLLSGALSVDGLYNIAVTGRYGSGKSSVLQRFASEPPPLS